MRKFPARRLNARRIATLGLAAALTAGGTAALPATASANSSQLAMFQDGSELVNAPAALAQFRELGANAVRVVVRWSAIAPKPNSKKKPTFNANDPNAYPAAGWATYDNIVRAAAADHLTLDFTLSGGAPRWAEGSGIPTGNTPFFSWKPSAADYGQFVRAVGERYDGHFTPPGQSSPLPAVHFWAIYNEPNFGEDLGPQAIKGSTVSVAPMMYRGLISAAWKSLHATGHSRDTILIGEFAARGLSGKVTKTHPQGLPGDRGQTKPLLFIRTLYCVDNNYHQLRGRTAKAVGCPTNAAGSRRFRAQNPGLFNASGVSDHPYPVNGSPINDGGTDPNFAAFHDLGNFGRTFDRVNSVYGSHKHFPIYNTEYGYITRPPATPPPVYVSPAKAAFYINWAEYLSYKNPRVKSYMQYLLVDPPASAGPYKAFASGLEFPNGKKKATFFAYRMPFYMPKTSFSRSQNVEVWGSVRPAPFATLDGFGAQRAQIQLDSGSGFKTINTVTVKKGGYFDVHMKFPSSGTVRVQWTYPTSDSFLADPNVQGQTIDSRTFAIKVH
jgi:hypothetical protein